MKIKFNRMIASSVQLLCNFLYDFLSVRSLDLPASVNIIQLFGRLLSYI